MTVEIRRPTGAELAAAAAIHFECLPGNNDDGRGGGWAPLHTAGGDPREVVLVAVSTSVVGYVFGDMSGEGVAVCQEVAVTTTGRRRGWSRTLLGSFARHAVTVWKSDRIYLQPIEPPWLTEFYERLGFVEDTDGSGHLWIAASKLAEVS